MLVGEAGYGDLESGRIAGGGWYYTSKQDHLDGAGRRHSNGFYAMVEKTIYTPDADGKRHLDIFARGANTAGTVSQFDFDWSTGLSYTGAIAARPNDVAGVMFHGANNSAPYLRATPGSTKSEWGMELTYAAQIKPWLSIQPDIQYINNPGTTEEIKDSWVVGFRSGVSF